MSRYRKIDQRIWNDQKFRALSDSAKLTFFMLLTHPSMTMLGAMRATVSGLAEELAWTAEAFREAFAEVLQQGMAEHDPKAHLIALPNFLKYNKPESPNVVKAWTSALDLLPECSLKTRVVTRSKGFAEGMSEGFREALPEAFAMAMPYQEQEQEPKQEQEQKVTALEAPALKKPRKRGAASATLVSVEQLVAEGVELQHATDWLIVRAKKGLPLTLTAWTDVKEEATAAGMPIAIAIKHAAVNGWGGFKSKWLTPERIIAGRRGAMTDEQRAAAGAASTAEGMRLLGFAGDGEVINAAE